MQNVLDIKALGLLLVTLVMLYLKYFVKYDLTAVFYHAITYSLFNYLQTKTSAKFINLPGKRNSNAGTVKRTANN